MLKVSRDTGVVRAETATAVFEWDLQRGGQLTRCVLRGRGPDRAILDGQPAPNLTLDLGGERARLADVPVEDVSYERDDGGCFIFSTKASLADRFVFEQRYEVFREGVVFCEFMLQVREGTPVSIRNAQMAFPLATGSASRMRGSYVSRDPYPKQDVTCVHILSDARVCIDRDETVDVPHLPAVYGLDLGWEDSRYYSHRVEMIIEDSTSIGRGMVGPTRAVAGPRDGGWALTWTLCEEIDEVFESPFFYRNRWGLLCGAGRTVAGEGAERPLANNAMAARVCHVMYPYVRDGDEWPWTSVPIRQTFYQDVQLATGNPDLARLDEAVELGCNVLVLHQFWMTNGGSNGEPMADYTPFDPAWMKAFIDRAHEHGMRVLLYGRGTERYQLYSDYFERYLKRDWDGVYLDWSRARAMGFCKTSALHFSAYDYFMFMRRVRERVGDGGLMIAHSGIQTYLACCQFDAVLVGEFSVMHSGLLDEPEKSASYAMLSGCGINLIAGNSGDRSIFSSQQAAAYCAGLGYSAHPFMEPDIEFAGVSAYMHPLWKLWQSLGDAPVRVFNPAVGEAHIARQGDDALHPIAYRGPDGTLLVTVTNLSSKPLSDGTVTLDFAALCLDPGATLVPLDVPGTHPLQVDGHRIHCVDMPPWAYGGVLYG